MALVKIGSGHNYSAAGILGELLTPMLFNCRGRGLRRIGGPLVPAGRMRETANVEGGCGNP